MKRFYSTIEKNWQLKENIICRYGWFEQKLCSRCITEIYAAHFHQFRSNGATLTNLKDEQEKLFGFMQINIIL